MGTFPSQSSQKADSINVRNKICLICDGQMTFTAFAYCLFEAKTIFEYGFGFYIVICMINGIVLDLLFTWKCENILKLIENCEEFMKKSKLATTLSLDCSINSYNYTKRCIIRNPLETRIWENGWAY